MFSIDPTDKVSVVRVPGAGKGNDSAAIVNGETGAVDNGPREAQLDEPSIMNGANAVAPQVPDADDDEPFVDDYAFNVDDEKLFAELLDNALFNKGNELLRRGGCHGKGGSRH